MNSETRVVLWTIVPFFVLILFLQVVGITRTFDRFTGSQFRSHIEIEGHPDIVARVEASEQRQDDFERRLKALEGGE